MAIKSILNSNNVVVNIIVLDEGAIWTPPDGYIIGVDGGPMGWIWDGIEYINPDPPILPNPEPEANTAPQVIE